jgi:hypothetical protein
MHRVSRPPNDEGAGVSARTFKDRCSVVQFDDRITPNWKRLSTLPRS